MSCGKLLNDGSLTISAIFCVQNRQAFGLYRLNQQRFTALGLFYLYFGLNTRFHFIKGSDRFEKSFQEILEQ
jgi:hypothetical protein